MNYEAFRSQGDHRHQTWKQNSPKELEALLNKIRIWDKVFKIPYFQYRKRLQEIAEKGWRAIDRLDAIIRDPEILLDTLRNHDAIVLPTDGDWYHPRISEALLAFDFNKIESIVWNQLRYTPAVHSKINPESDKVEFENTPFLTKNYCLTSNFLKKINSKEILLFLKDHIHSKKEI